ncbi:MAG: DsbA family protein [Pseudomonadales bacterium]
MSIIKPIAARLRVRLASGIMATLASPGFARLRQRRGRLRRQLARGVPVLHYCHQADDPYSHLAVQRLEDLAARYRVHVVPLLVPPPEDAYKGDRERYPSWALADARDVAPFYGVAPPALAAPPHPEAVTRANRLLAPLGPADFAATAMAVGRRLWSGDDFAGEALPPERDATRRLAADDRLRTRLGHYLGAMFHFEGEWYWGLDRLCHLEARLRAEGLSRQPDAAPCVPRPMPEAVQDDAAAVTLEVFPSLRSPYTAVSFRRTLDLARRSGVRLVLRPVMPMMMRGVPAPRPKQIYILTDAAREGRACGHPLGRPVDPFGEPVRRALSLWAWADAAGRGAEYLAEYLDAAWVDGVDVTTDAGLAVVLRRAGLDWEQARSRLGGDESDAVLAANLDAMLGAGLWGVPSYRVSGGRPDAFACWGQDRLWRVETEIARRAADIARVSANQ